MELIRLVNDELDANASSVKERLYTLEKQISDVDSRLEHLYDALERGSFNSDELAPRIRKLQARRNELLQKSEEINLETQRSVLELPDLELVREYVGNLRTLLGSSTIVEQRGFLKSFVKEIRVNDSAVIVNYELPMPPDDSLVDKISVLPFVQHGRPYRSRTCDTLIKSQGVSNQARREVKTLFRHPDSR